jgi:hypothetical protein
LETSGKTQNLSGLTPEKAPVPNYQRLGGAQESFWTFWRRGNLFSLVGGKNWGRPGRSLGVGTTMIALSLVLRLVIIIPKNVGLLLNNIHILNKVPFFSVRTIFHEISEVQFEY